MSGWGNVIEFYQSKGVAQNMENENTASRDPASDDESLDQARKVAIVVYALQAAAFLIGITYIVALIFNYVKLDEVRGTWLESHFRWQIRTFWYSLLWTAVGIITMVVFIGHVVLLANGVWVIYRIVKGWLNLSENKPMYAS